MNKFLQKAFSISFILVFFYSSGWCLTGKESKDSLECLEISGMVTKGGKPQGDVVIKLWHENEEEATINIKKQNKFKFVLKKGSVYTIQVTKAGFITRLVSISTQLPPGTVIETLYRFYFELELVEEKNDLDTYFIDFPSAYISYDSTIDGFQNDSKYSSYIKKAIYK